MVSESNQTKVDDSKNITIFTDKNLNELLAAKRASMPDKSELEIMQLVFKDFLAPPYDADISKFVESKGRDYRDRPNSILAYVLDNCLADAINQKNVKLVVFLSKGHETYSPRVYTHKWSVESFKLLFKDFLAPPYDKEYYNGDGVIFRIKNSSPTARDVWYYFLDQAVLMGNMEFVKFLLQCDIYSETDLKNQLKRARLYSITYADSDSDKKLKIITELKWLISSKYGSNFNSPSFSEAFALLAPYMKRSSDDRRGQAHYDRWVEGDGDLWLGIIVSTLFIIASVLIMALVPPLVPFVAVAGVLVYSLGGVTIFFSVFGAIVGLSELVVYNRHVAMAKKLSKMEIESGHGLDKYGHTTLVRTAMNGTVQELITLLMKDKKASYSQEELNTALYAARLSTEPELMKEVLDKYVKGNTNFATVVPPPPEVIPYAVAKFTIPADFKLRLYSIKENAPELIDHLEQHFKNMVDELQYIVKNGGHDLSNDEMKMAFNKIQSEWDDLFSDKKSDEEFYNAIVKYLDFLNNDVYTDSDFIKKEKVDLIFMPLEKQIDDDINLGRAAAAKRPKTS